MEFCLFLESLTLTSKT